MAIVTLRSDLISVEIDADRGGEVRAISMPGLANALAYYPWTSPLPAGIGPSFGSTELDWLSKYRAGWQFLFPNSGAESEALGVAVAFHGEASLAPVTVETLSATECTVRTAARLPLELRRTIRVSLDEPVVFVEETVRNVGVVDTPFLWGHHPTFPALAGAQIDLPTARYEVEPSAPGDLVSRSGVWPTGEAGDGREVDLRDIPEARMVRLLYLYDLDASWAALRQPEGSDSPGVAVGWDGGAYPQLWLWLQNGDAGFPWFGRARMLGIEPQRTRPFDGLAGAVERGDAVWLAPGAEVSSWLTLSLLPPGAPPVVGVARDGRVQHG